MANESLGNGKRIAVLGAGCSGLAAAWQLVKCGHEVSLYEQQDNVGGLSRGIGINGNTYQYGPHIFHTTDPEIFADIREIGGNELFPVQRTILIKFLGTYFRYPLSVPDVIFKLPKMTILEAFVSFLFNSVKFSIITPDQETSETVLLKNYGRTLYKIFFKDYIEHVWGMSPSEFSPKFARQRIPQLSALNFLFKLASGFHKAAEKKISTSEYVENVEGQIYSTKRGFAAVVERMAEKIKEHRGIIYLDSEVTKLKRYDNGTFGIETNFHPNGNIFNGVISTIPINYLAQIIEPNLTEKALEAAKKLRFRGVTFVGLLIDRKRVLPASLTYFRDLSFNRITDLSHFGIEVNPEGSTILIAEITCDKGDRFWNDDYYTKESVIKELEAEQVISRKMIREVHVYRFEHAYPVYSLGFEKNLETILREIESFGNLMVSGRQGLFRYVNMHVAMKMGYEAADNLMKNLSGRKD